MSHATMCSAMSSSMGVEQIIGTLLMPNLNQHERPYWIRRSSPSEFPGRISKGFKAYFLMLRPI